MHISSGGGGGAAAIKSISDSHDVGLRILININETIIASAHHAVAVDTELQSSRNNPFAPMDVECSCSSCERCRRQRRSRGRTRAGLRLSR